MELDHNPMIHQQAMAEVNQKKKTLLRNIIRALHIREDIYKQMQSLLTSSQAEHN
jgi:hypothetical protein